MEEARYLEVAKKVGGKLERDRSDTICSTLTSVQRLHNVQHVQNPAIPMNVALFCVTTEKLKYSKSPGG